MPRGRSAETRASTTRKVQKREMPQVAYESDLYVPPEIIPDGMAYRWIGKTADNAPIPGNWARKMRQGWRPVPRSRHEDLYPFIATPGINEDASIIEMGGLVLCEIEKGKLQQRREMLQNEAIEQMNSIAWTTEGLNGAPTVNQSGKVERGQMAFKQED